MIGPFSTTLVPLSSSSSVDRQELINVEASAISPDERTFGFIFTKIPFTRRSDEEEKGSRSLDQIARTFSLFAPPQNVLAPAATACNIWERGRASSPMIAPLGLDAVVQAWPRLRLYALGPIALLPGVLVSVRRVRLVLVSSMFLGPDLSPLALHEGSPLTGGGYDLSPPPGAVEAVAYRFRSLNRGCWDHPPVLQSSSLEVEAFHFLVLRPPARPS